MTVEAPPDPQAPPGPEVPPESAKPPRQWPSKLTVAAVAGVIGLLSGGLGLVFDAFPTLRPDPRTDLAVLKLKGGGGDFPILELGDSDLLEVGDFVIAIGDPFGVGQTVTQGIVSALARTQPRLRPSKPLR